MKKLIFKLGILLIASFIIAIVAQQSKKEITFDDVITKTEFRFYSDEALKNNIFSDVSLIRFNNGQLRYGPHLELKYEIEMPYASGDLDNDGDKDYAILIYNWNGGSGQFLSLSTILNVNGKPIQSSIIGIGDRVQVKSIVISNAIIAIDLIDLRFRDEWQSEYKLVNGFLERIKKEP